MLDLNRHANSGSPNFNSAVSGTIATTRQVLRRKQAMYRRARTIMHSVVIGLLALFAASVNSAFAAGGKLVIADAFAPTAGWAMETDDSFVLTRVGCLEALARIDFEGALVPALATGWEQALPTEWDVTIRRGREVPQRRGPQRGRGRRCAESRALGGRAARRRSPPRSLHPSPRPGA